MPIFENHQEKLIYKMSSSLKSDLLKFLNDSPVPYFFCEKMRETLEKEGFTELSIFDKWEDTPKKGFVINDNRALVAFNIGGYDSAIIVGTHSDSPCLKIRDKPDINNKKLKQVQVFTYGGGLWYTWLGRDLRLVGTVTIRNNNASQNEKTKKLIQINFDSKDPIAFVPNCDIGSKPNPNLDTGLIPIIGGRKSPTLLSYVAKSLKVNEEDIVDWDLSFVDANPPQSWRTFIESQRIDNLSSTFCAVKAFLQSEPKNTINILVVFDNEEVGSQSRFGACGDILSFVIKRLVKGGPKQLNPFIAKSLLVSSDNSHAIHPNFSSKHDKMHSPYLGKGVIIKKAPGATYATDMTSTYPVKHAANKCKIPLQYFMNRNDIPAGSTIGPIVSSLIGIPTVDIGLPQLSMHSVRETMAFKDVEHLINLLIELYNNYEEHRLIL